VFLFVLAMIPQSLTQTEFIVLVLERFLECHVLPQPIKAKYMYIHIKCHMHVKHEVSFDRSLQDYK